jgi:uncharacterized protein
VRAHTSGWIGNANVEIAMRDGIVLRADIIRPDTTEQVPVILIRNPYPIAVARRQLDHLRAVQMGFAVVMQAVRGTGASDGQFAPWRHEVEDGVDTIAWCASQRWSSGRIGTYGSSYLAHVQTYAASASPPALAAMSLGVPPANPYDLTYHGGALMLASTLNWSLSQAAGRVMRTVANGATSPEEIAEVRALMDNFEAVTRTTPLRDISLLARRFPEWSEWLNHPSDDSWWASVAVPDRPAIPTLTTAGWWDIFLNDSINEFARQPRHSSSRLVIGPWSHIIEGTGHGDIYFGPSSGGPAADVEGMRLSFLGDHLLPGSNAKPQTQPQTPPPETSPVRIFVMGRNKWRDEDQWPPTRAVIRHLYFGSNGGLSQHPPSTEAPQATYIHDPLDPVPTVGGANLLPGSEGAHNTGPVEQSRLDLRRDILRFRSEPQNQDVEVTGHVAVTLWASTTAIDTDWTAKLVDVWPDGRAYNVCDGIIRARYRNGTSTPVFIAPRQPAQFTIDLGATAHVFVAGHRIRVDIASSNFPRFDRNPGTGKLSADEKETRFVSAKQTVFLDARRTSFVALPVIGHTSPEQSSTHSNHDST